MQEQTPLLRSIDDLTGYGIVARDGEIGSAADYYFDDQSWTIRYLIADTGGWLFGRRVLISPMAFEKADWENKKLYLSLTKQQIEDSPGIDQDEPVSRQFEERYYRYYGWAPYWGGSGLWGAGYYPTAVPFGYYAPAVGKEEKDTPENKETGDPNLRSAKEVIGYTIMGTDDSIGNVRDFIVSDHSWEIQWIVVDTSPWWFGGNVLIHPGSIREVSWENKSVYVNLTRAQIKNSPEWNRNKPISQEYNARLLAYYRQNRAA